MCINKITLINKVLLKITLVSAFVFSLSVNAALEVVLENNNPVNLFGIGVHQEKRFDIYVGALYAPSTVSSVSEMNDPYMAKRMSLKFISKYSNRKMSRMWKQRIAMNNSKDKWRPMTKEIVQFASIFKRAMQAGDEINIDYIPSVGTKVYLNGTEFITIENPEFFELLLNIWIGSVPPTELFKTGISGSNPDSLQSELVAKFDSLTPEVGRFDSDLSKPQTQVASTRKNTNRASQTNSKPAAKKETPAKKPEVKKAAEKKAEPKNTTPPPVRRQASQTNNNQAPAKQTTAKPEAAKSSENREDLFKTDLGAKKVTEVETKPEPKLETANNNEKANTAPASSAPAKTQAAKKQPEVSETKVAKLDPPEEFFDADLLSGSYTQELINTIRKYQSYPKKALAAGEEGNVTALVTIDKDGEILDYEITERAASRTLNREVLRMIRRAAPFPKIPPELELEQFEFEVPMNFKLAR